MSAGYDAAQCDRCDAGDHENCMGTLRDNQSLCTCSICWHVYDSTPTDEELENMRKEMER